MDLVSRLYAVDFAGGGVVHLLGNLFDFTACMCEIFLVQYICYRYVGL